MKDKIHKIKNKQRSTARTFGFLTIVAVLMVITPNMIDVHFSAAAAISFLGIFLSISFFVVALLFKRRAKKMDRLKSGENLLVHFEMTEEMQKKYAQTLRDESKMKNKATMWLVGILFVIITIPFLFFLEKDEIGGFLLTMGAVLLIVFAASIFFPVHYYKKNLNGDKQIMIGEKYAYFNGYFHNWDYPLSGLSKIKQIRKPFPGIHLVYYYTDLTWRNTHDIKIPLPEDFDAKPLISKIKRANK